MVYHCARCYSTGLTIYQLPCSHNTKISTLYTYYYTCIPKHLSFNTYHIPQHNHIFIFINNSITINTFNFINIHLSSQFSIQIYHNSITYIFINNFHNHKYNQILSISIYHHNSQFNISQLNHIYFINNFHNQIYTTKYYPNVNPIS
jgi:hypothetical protein